MVYYSIYSTGSTGIGLGSKLPVMFIVKTIPGVRLSRTSSTRTLQGIIMDGRPYVGRLLGQSSWVQADVWRRLLYHMLPVNCRFSYLQIERPDAICCANGCGSVETEHHAFHTCTSIYPIWSFQRVGPFCRGFGVVQHHAARPLHHKRPRRRRQGRDPAALAPLRRRDAPPRVDGAQRRPV